MRIGREQGYAMIAAIMGIAAFGFIAYELLAQNRGVLAEVRGEAEQANLAAACNAGIYATIAGLANKDLTQRWGIDGRSRSAQFGDIALTITVEDERGKIPLNGIIEEEVSDLFSLAGASPEQLHVVVESFEDWQDSDNSPRPNGAEAPDYAGLGYRPRNAAFRTIGELRMIKGMNDALFARVAPAVTVFFGESGGFSESTSQPLALEVLGEVSPNSPEVIARQKELAGEQPLREIIKKVTLTARTLTVRVEARRRGAYLKRTAIVELTSNAADPYWVRYLD